MEGVLKKDSCYYHIIYMIKILKILLELSISNLCLITLFEVHQI